MGSETQDGVYCVSFARKPEIPHHPEPAPAGVTYSWLLEGSACCFLFHEDSADVLP